MLRFIVRRLFSTFFVLFGVSLLVFTMIHLIPGDPALMVAGVEATEEQVEKIRQSLGLDRPFHVQYLDYVTNALKGDMGRSIHSRQQVVELIRGAFPATFELTTASIIVAGIFGIIIGVVSAVRQYSIFDYISMLGALTGISMPIFWIALLLMWFFSIHLGWLPTGGWDEKFWSFNGLRHAGLPILTLSGISIAMIVRLTRSTMLEVIRQDYITTARAKGLREFYVIYLHALRNAMIPVVTFIGLQYGILLGGAVVTEQIFSIPGIGRLVLQAIYDRDYPIIQGCILFLSAIFIIINLVVDLLYGLLDPRIRND